MALHTPVWMEPQSPDAAVVYSGAEMRLEIRALLAAMSGVPGQQGINGTSFAVVQRGAGANFSVDCGSGTALVVGDDTPNQGSYACFNDGTVNRTVPSPPSSGTNVHRVVLQVQDKLSSSGIWSGYTADVMVLADTSNPGTSATPNEPNSAITLALVTVAAGQANVSNANITDMRQLMGPVNAVKTSDQSRTSTSLTDDGALQLLNLPANAWLALDCAIIYSAGTGGSDAFNLTWRTTGVTNLKYNRMDGAGTGGSINTKDRTDTISANGTGTGVLMPLNLTGYINTGAAPCLAVVQWAGGSTNSTTLRAGSRITARQIA